MAGRPVVKVFGKRKKDGDPALPEYVDLAAWWVNDDGRLGGQWSRDLVAIKVKDRDGKTHVLTAEQLKSYFCNLRDDREGAPAPRAAKPAPRADEGPPDFGDDGDLPF